MHRVFGKLNEGAKTMSNNFNVDGRKQSVSSVENDGPIDANFCTLCVKKAMCKCERCGDFYCSLICQRKDWPNHRFICFPMPRLIKAERLTEIIDGVGENVSHIKAETIPIKTNKDDKDGKETKKPTNSSMPTNGSCVILTGFKSLNRCYIRSANPTITEEYIDVLKKIDEFGKTSEELSEWPKRNSYALALKQDKWCRVEITDARPNRRLRIFFIDYGTSTLCYQKDLRNISSSLATLPCFVHMVKLQGNTKFSIEEKQLDTLSQFVNKEFRIQFVKSDEIGGNVKLYHWGSNKLLNSEVLNLCSKLSGKEKESEIVSASSSCINVTQKEKQKETSAVEKANHIENKIELLNVTDNNELNNENNTNKSTNLQVANSITKKRKPRMRPRQIQLQKPCLEPPFEIIPLNENDSDCTVLIVDNSYIGNGYIGCLLDKYCDNLKAIASFLKEFNINDRPYKPKYNEYCLAEFENEWYRAKVVEVISEDKFQVVYIDFTNEMELTSKSIRRYPTSLNLACYTTLCAIKGLPEHLSDELIDFLENKCATFTKLSIDNVHIADDIRYIESKDLMKTLHDAKML